MWVRTTWNQLLQVDNFRVDYGITECCIYTDKENQKSTEFSKLLAKYQYQFEVELEIERIESYINNPNINVFRFSKPLKESDLYEIAKNNGIKEEILEVPRNKNAVRYGYYKEIKLKSYEGECIVNIKGKQFFVKGWPSKQHGEVWCGGAISFKELHGEGETSHHFQIGGEVANKRL